MGFPVVITVKWPKAELDRYAGRAGASVQRFASEFIQELNNQVIIATPVDTGFLRNSWFGSIGSPSGGAGGSGGASALDVATVKLWVGDVFYATNTASYAGFVEYGTIRMAPRAFVRNTIARAQEIATMVANRIRASL
jgi:hypothetical protein